MIARHFVTAPEKLTNQDAKLARRGKRVSDISKRTPEDSAGVKGSLD